MKNLFYTLLLTASLTASAGIPYTNTPPFNSGNRPQVAGPITIQVSVSGYSGSGAAWSQTYSNDYAAGHFEGDHFSFDNGGLNAHYVDWNGIDGWQFSNDSADCNVFWFKSDSTGTNIEGAYPGIPATGDCGAIDGTATVTSSFYVNTAAADVAGINGAAIGNKADGSAWGAAVGNGANGSSFGLAMGNGADGHGLGNVAVGGDTNGLNTARVLDGLIDTIELGRGVATNPGGLHFRGKLIVDNTGTVVAPVSGGSSLSYTPLGLHSNADSSTFSFYVYQATITNKVPGTNVLGQVTNSLWSDRSGQSFTVNQSPLTNAATNINPTVAQLPYIPLGVNSNAASATYAGTASNVLVGANYIVSTPIGPIFSSNNVSLWGAAFPSLAISNRVILGTYSNFYGGSINGYTNNGGLSPLHYAEIDISFDNGTNWTSQYNTPSNCMVSIAAIIGGDNSWASNVVLYGYAPDAYGNNLDFGTQIVSVDSPGSARNVANKAYVDALGKWYTTPALATPSLNAYGLTIDGNWGMRRNTSVTNANSLAFYYGGQPAFQLLSGAGGTNIAYSVAMQVTSTNILFVADSAGMTSAPAMVYASALTIPYASWTNGTLLTNWSDGVNWYVSMSVPTNPITFWRMKQFFSGTTNVSATLAGPMTATAFVTTPRTITNSTDSTSGSGAGLVTWDTNYVYVSVGTNLWKRASLSSW